MTIDEQRIVLQKLSRARFGAELMLSDSICYGGNVESYSEQRKYADEVIKAFPEDIRQAYDAELRKVEADKLRAKADAIERGEK